MQNRHRKVGNILLAEDDPVVRGLSCQLLERAGHRITAVNDGLAAWHALNEGEFDLLVTDNDMPNLTGVQLVAKLRINKVRLPIILASGSADFFRGEEYRWLDFSACLQKPFTPDELREGVKRVLGVVPVSEMVTRA